MLYSPDAPNNCETAHAFSEKKREVGAGGGDEEFSRRILYFELLFGVLLSLPIRSQVV
jgi:hypothetical protein